MATEKLPGINPLPLGRKQKVITWAVHAKKFVMKPGFSLLFQPGNHFAKRLAFEVWSTYLVCFFSRNFTCAGNEQMSITSLLSSGGRPWENSSTGLSHSDQAQLSWTQWPGAGSVQESPGASLEAVFALQVLPCHACVALASSITSLDRRWEHWRGWLPGLLLLLSLNDPARWVLWKFWENLFCPSS